MLPRSRLRGRLRDVAAHALDLSGITRPGRCARGRLTIVTFHRVLPLEQLADYPLPVLAVTPEELRWFLGFFQREFECGTLRDGLVRLAKDPLAKRPSLAITFDDGQRDNYLHARPILDSLGLRASFFVPLDAMNGAGALWHDRLGFLAQRLLRDDPYGGGETLRSVGLVGRDAGSAVRSAKLLTPAARRSLLTTLEAAHGGDATPEWDGFMSWEQLAELARSGHEIGSHAMSHELLTQLDDGALKHELETSRALLRERLDAPVDSFCYPNGDCDARVVEATRRAGYAQAVTTRWGLNSPTQGRYELLRCDMASRHVRDRRGTLSPPRLAWRLSGYYPGLN